jgi:hypothetical protein
MIWLRKALGITGALGIAASVGILLEATPVPTRPAVAQPPPQSGLDLTRPIYAVTGAVICNKTLVNLVYSDARYRGTIADADQAVADLFIHPDRSHADRSLYPCGPIRGQIVVHVLDLRPYSGKLVEISLAPDMEPYLVRPQDLTN